MPGSLFLSARRTLDEKRLLEALRAECRKKGKPYGIWARKLRSFSQQQGTGGHGSIRFMAGLVYLVDAKTGALTLERDLDLVATPRGLLDNLRAAGNDSAAANILVGAPVSVVTPSLLFSDGELQRSESRPEKPPILPAPDLAAKTAPAKTPRIVPTIPQAPHVQVQRYVIRGAGTMYPKFVIQDVVDSRQHMEGDDAFIDFKVVGASLGQLGASLRRLDAAMGRLAPGKKLESSPLTPTLTLSAYVGMYGDGWPR
jgi:hypothetical protein